MSYGDTVHTENNSPEYQVGFQSAVDESYSIRVTLVHGDPSDFLGEGSDALLQDVLDRLEASPLLLSGSGSKSWAVHRAILPTAP